MKVLFVSSGNNKFGVSPIIKNQGESLKKEGIEVEYFTIKGKGVKGYLKASQELRKHLKINSYDIIHAHYWLSGITATLAGAKPLVVSLMGDDVKAKAWFRWIIFIFYKLFWDKTIVKSQDMYESFNQKGVEVISNGVDLDRFKPIDKEEALKRLGWSSEKKHILFTANPDRYVKNFPFAKRAFEFINNGTMELHYLKNISNEEVVYYYNAADVVIMTSHWEGSPNAIKEALACNAVVVSRDVGDIKELLKEVKGCHVVKGDEKDFGEYILKAIAFNNNSNGRENIAHLSSSNVAKRVIKLYKELIKDK